MSITKSTKRRYIIVSLFFAAVAILAYFSPDHLCDYFIHIPWLNSLCPYVNDESPFKPKTWGKSNPYKKNTNTPTIDLTTLPHMTLDELKLHNGENEGYPLYLAINGVVFNVDTTEGNRFYSKSQSYHVFAGGDYTRALALGSLQQRDIDLKDDVSDFTSSQRKELLDRVQFYLDKYEPVAIIKKDTL
jgi:predicted heme/steroid binding protein